MRYFLILLAMPVFGADCSLTGQIADPSGAPVPGAAVSLLSPNRIALAAAFTQPDGRFSVNPAPCGDFILSAGGAGFAETRQAVHLRPGADAALALTLSLVPVEEHLTVSAEAGTVESPAWLAQRVNTIPRSAIAERAKTTLTDIAEGEPGVHALRTAPAMGAFYVRGLTGNKVSVYRDGFRYTTSVQRGGVSTFQNLTDPALLDSVEILRGPNSAQYGSDSLGGSVALLSTFPLAQSKFVTGEFAPSFDSATLAPGANSLISFYTPRVNTVLALAGRRVNTMQAARGLDTNAAVTRFFGLPANVLGDRLPDTGFTQYGGSLHTQFRPDARQYLLFHMERNQQDGAKRYDQLSGGDGNLIADLRNLMLDFGYLRYQRFQAGPFERISAGVSFNAQREERVNQGGNGDPRGSISHQYEKLRAWGVVLQAERRIQTHSLALGGESYLERIASPAFTFNPVSGVTARSRPRIPDGARYLSHGVYVSDVWEPVRKLRLNGSIRFGGASYSSARTYPFDSLTANGLTGRAGASFRPLEPLALYAHYSRGFRTPNMTDLGTLGLQGNGFFEANVNDAMAFGSPTIGSSADDKAQPTGLPVSRLRPETSDNYEAGASFTHARVRVEVTGFAMNLGNTIVSQTLLLPAGATGLYLGDQPITSQLASGAVFVPAATAPVQVRANYYGARLRGVEQSLRVRVNRSLTLNENLTWIDARDANTGLPPDIEPGIPPVTAYPSVLYTHPTRRFWVEAYSTLAARQTRLSSLALSDRRIGATRSRSNIARYFANGAAVRGLVAGGVLIPTGETLAEVQNRVLGTANSAPLNTAIPGYGLVGVRAGIPVGESADFFADVSNIGNRAHRGIGWGVPGLGRSLTVRYRVRF
ncbi:MAG: TonB-dependent receptor [Bryobacteraceae bacterium]